MKIIIVEDEKAAVRNLKALLQEVKPDAEVEGTLDSITAVLDWFSTHPMPDMLFLDIHLADGSAFEIFDHLDITCPIVFTTAYDEYALRAFKVNSIDYLLKPIGREDIENAFRKLEHLHVPGHGSEQTSGLVSELASEQVGEPVSERKAKADDSLVQLIRSLKKRESYKAHFLIPIKGDKLLPVSVDMILLFYIQDCKVNVVLADGKEYVFPQTLDEVAESLDPALFFRVNRQFLISREAIKDIDLWFNNRLSINLRCKVTDEKVLVSKARVQEFKEWFSRI